MQFRIWFVFSSSFLISSVDLHKSLERKPAAHNEAASPASVPLNYSIKVGQ